MTSQVHPGKGHQDEKEDSRNQQPSFAKDQSERSPCGDSQTAMARRKTEWRLIHGRRVERAHERIDVAGAGKSKELFKNCGQDHRPEHCLDQHQPFPPMNAEQDDDNQGNTKNLLTKQTHESHERDN
jgi:hypothetical protein